MVTSAELPQLWIDLAQAPKKQDLVTIQQAFDHMVNTHLNMLGSQIPVTPDIASKICSLSFEMVDKEDLMMGIHLFTSGYQKDRGII